MSFDFDYIVIGSGFGGSVAAHRLTEKGYRVGVMEMGKRWRAEDFPKSNWKIWRWIWRRLAACSANGSSTCLIATTAGPRFTRSPWNIATRNISNVPLSPFFPMWGKG